MPIKPLFKLTSLSALFFAHLTYGETFHTQQLPTVNVQAPSAMATHRINNKQLNESTAISTKEVLFNEPSVSFGAGNGTAQWLTIRGLGQNHIDVKVDNAYTDTQIFHHSARFLLDPSLIKVIAVQKGTGFASAGIGATSGAIVAKTLDARDLLADGQDAGFKVNALWSSNKGYTRGATVFGRYQGLEGLLSGNWIHHDDYTAGKGYSSATGNKINNSGLGQRGLLAKLSYNLDDNNRITLSHRQEKTYGTRNLREEFDFSQSNNVSRNNPRYRTLTQDTTQLEYDGNALDTLGYAKANAYQMTQKRTESGSTGSVQVKTIGANVGFDTPIVDGRHTIKYGLNWRHQETSPTSHNNNTVNEKKTDTGAYLEGIWNLEPITLNTGIRYDHFKANYNDGKNISGGNFNPSLGINYQVNPNLSLNGSLNYATRSPRLSEAALSGARIYRSDDNLKAERSRNAEIGFKYNWNQVLDVDGHYFWQNIKDQVAYDRNSSRYYNDGTLKNQGYELNGQYRWNGLVARAGVSYNRSKLNGGDINNILAAVPKGRTWTTGLSYQFDNPNIEVGWRGRFVQNISYGTPTEKRAGYGVNDVYLNWKPTGKDNFNVNLAVNNLADKNYKSHGQRTSGASLPETGRDVRLGVNYQF